MTTVLRVGVLAIATSVAFVAGRVSSKPERRGPAPAPAAGATTSDPGPPSEAPPWATHGFRDAETCESVFKDPG
jgi:hypothetical protein